jgi:regulation of enolase protein 1 (concanavalin A-like superfamily)
MRGPTWTTEPPHWSEENGVLDATSGDRTDFWQGTYYGFQRDDGHARLTRVGAAWSARVTFEGRYESLYDQAGLMLRASASVWIKAGIEWTDGAPHLSVVVTDGLSDWSARPVAEAGAVTLRMTRLKGAVLVQRAVPDGWEMMRLAPFLPDIAGVGPYLCSPERAGFRASFRDLRIGAPEVEALH